jgi:hypothetical protein
MPVLVRARLSRSTSGPATRFSGIIRRPFTILGGTASTSLGRTWRSGLLLRSNGCALLYFGDLAAFTSDGGIRSILHEPDATAPFSAAVKSHGKSQGL